MAELEIRQTESPAPQESPHTLVLRGLAGPVDAIDWGEGSQRSVVDWHAGSGQASVSLLGPEEGEASLEFRWRGRDIGGTDAALWDGAALASVEDLVRVADKLRRDRALVAVSWRGDERVGFVARVSVREERLSEFEVSMRVQWVQAQDYRQPAPAVAPQVSEVSGAVGSEWEAVEAVSEPVTVPRLTGEAIARAVDGVGAEVARLARVAADLTAPGGVERGLFTVAGYTPAARQAQAAAEVLGAVRSAAVTLGAAAEAPVGETAQSDEPVARMDTRLYLARTGRTARRVRDVAALEGGRFVALTSGALAVHDAIEGETVFGLALRYYGDVRGWRAIAAANELPRTTLRAGQRVVIPRRGGSRA